MLRSHRRLTMPTPCSRSSSAWTWPVPTRFDNFRFFQFDLVLHFWDATSKLGFENAQKCKKKENWQFFLSSKSTQAPSVKIWKNVLQVLEWTRVGCFGGFKTLTRGPSWPPRRPWRFWAAWAWAGAPLSSIVLNKSSIMEQAWHI